jgi:hypothetical protein
MLPKLIQEKKGKNLLIFPANCSAAGVWGILHCGGIQ